MVNGSYVSGFGGFTLYVDLLLGVHMKIKYKLNDVVWFINEKSEVHPAQIERIYAVVSIDEPPQTTYGIGGIMKKKEDELFASKKEAILRVEKKVKSLSTKRNSK
jgi:hypothetical protein